MAVGYIRTDVPVKSGASTSNGFRDNRGADFVSNERTNTIEVYTSSAKRLTCVSPKNSKMRQPILVFQKSVRLFISWLNIDPDFVNK